VRTTGGSSAGALGITMPEFSGGPIRIGYDQ
jgi:hypothetical protein